MKLIIIAALFYLVAADDRIIGGQMATPGQVPHIANLRQYNSQFCGATLVSPNWLVSAAHCYVKANKITVTVGDFDLSVVEPHEVTVVPTLCERHPQYNSRSLVNDIMMIQLPSALETTNYIEPALLPTFDEVLSDGDSCEICGWGNLRNSGTSLYPDELYCVNGVKVINIDVCNAEDSYNSEVLPGMICIGDMNGGKDSCQGDSGGPVICNGKLHGVVSWGYGCAEPNYPGVYAEVRYYHNWIMSFIDQ